MAIAPSRLLLATSLAALVACGDPPAPPAPPAPAAAPAPAAPAAPAAEPATPAAAPATPPAAASGGFHAIGQEPGWFAEVGGGATPTLHVEADYGETVIDGHDVRVEADGWTARTADGGTLTLRFLRRPCADAMSGREYPATAALAIGERRYSGCGEFVD